MEHVLPKTKSEKRLRTELKFVRTADLDDAVQEAWVAHLEGRNPVRAVATYAQQRRRDRSRLRVSSGLLWVLGC